MEAISFSDLSFYGFLTSLLVLGIIEATKYFAAKWGKTISPRLMVLALALLVGFGYQAYTQFMPEETREAIWVFVLGAMGFATLVYDFLVKPLSKIIK